MAFVGGDDTNMKLMMNRTRIVYIIRGITTDDL